MGFSDVKTTKRLAVSVSWFTKPKNKDDPKTRAACYKTTRAVKRDVPLDQGNLAATIETERTAQSTTRD